jgi:hypothetical protein
LYSRLYKYAVTLAAKSRTVGWICVGILNFFGYSKKHKEKLEYRKKSNKSIGSNVLIFAYFANSQTLMVPIKRLLLEFQNQGWFIIVVENLHLQDPPDEVVQIANIWIKRTNNDYDFGAYRIGLAWLRKSNAFRDKSLNKIIFCNSSVYYTPKFMSTLLPRIIMKNESIGLVRSEQFVNHIQTFFFMIVGKCIFKRSLHFAIGNKHSISSKQDLIYREVGLSIALGNQRNRLRGLFPDLFVETNS